MSRQSCLDWHFVLLKLLHVDSISSKMLKIEGLGLLVFLSNNEKYKHNLALRTFVKSGWMNIVKRASNKMASVVNFKIWFDRIRRKVKQRGPAPSSMPKPIIVYKLGYRKKLWISIGINDYRNTPDMPSLRNAVNDANAINNFAVSKLNFRSKLLTDKNASKNHIETLMMRDLYSDLDEDDLLVISFHGHGHTIFIGDFTHGFIIPYGASDLSPASLISMDSLASWTKLLKCRHILLILDCCFSGIMAMRSKFDRSAKPKVPHPPDGEPIITPRTAFRRRSIYANLCRNSRVVINAGAHDETIADGGIKNNSVLTGLIISYDKYKQTNGSVYSLFSYLSKEVPNYVEQTPTMGKLVGDRGGDIFMSL